MLWFLFFCRYVSKNFLSPGIISKNKKYRLYKLFFKTLPKPNQICGITVWNMTGLVSDMYQVSTFISF